MLCFGQLGAPVFGAAVRAYQQVFIVHMSGGEDFDPFDPEHPGTMFALESM